MPKKTNTKLTLKKMTIESFVTSELNQVKGGAITDTCVHCMTNYCPSGPCPVSGICSVYTACCD